MRKSNKSIGKKSVTLRQNNRMLSPLNQSRVFPPTFQVSKIVSLKRRFTTQAAISNAAFTINTGHNQFLVATTSILASSYVDCWRIKKVEAWSQATAVGTSGYVEIIPVFQDPGNNCVNDIATPYADNSSGTDIPAHVVWNPPKTSPSGMWHVTNTINGSANLFLTTASSGTVVDITFDVVLNIPFASSAYTVAIVAGTAGTLYTKVIASNYSPFGTNVVA